jgi:hypothetical protein
VAFYRHLATFLVNKVTRSTRIEEYTLGHRHPAITTYSVGRSKDSEHFFILPTAEHWAAIGTRSPNNSLFVIVSNVMHNFFTVFVGKNEINLFPCVGYLELFFRLENLLGDQ